MSDDNEYLEEKELTIEERRERVFNLNIELRDTQIKKKSVVGAYNDEIKRLNAEIKELIGKNNADFSIV